MREDLHDKKVLFIKKHLDMVNEFGEKEWELDSINSEADIVTFKHIGQKVRYEFGDDMLSITYFHEIKYRLYD